MAIANADISKCTGTDVSGCNCYVKEKCRRYVAPSEGQYQAWILIDGVDKCEHYLEVKK